MRCLIFPNIFGGGSDAEAATRSEAGASTNYLDQVEATVRYMEKISEGSSLAEPFRLHALFAQMMGSVDMVSGGQATTVKAASTLRHDSVYIRV